MAFNEKGPVLISSIIEDILGIDVSVLCGANIAKDVAWEHFSETTVGNDGQTPTPTPTLLPPRCFAYPRPRLQGQGGGPGLEAGVPQSFVQRTHATRTHIHTHTHARTHARTHTHAHSLFMRLVCNIFVGVTATRWAWWRILRAWSCAAR
jgi:hypothetical protein